MEVRSLHGRKEVVDGLLGPAVEESNMDASISYLIVEREHRVFCLGETSLCEEQGQYHIEIIGGK